MAFVAVAFIGCFSSLDVALLSIPFVFLLFLLYYWYWLLRCVSTQGTAQVHHMSNTYVVFVLSILMVSCLFALPEVLLFWPHGPVGLCTCPRWPMASRTAFCFKQLAFHFHWKNYRETTTAQKNPNAAENKQLRTRLTIWYDWITSCGDVVPFAGLFGCSWLFHQPLPSARSLLPAVVAALSVRAPLAAQVIGRLWPRRNATPSVGRKSPS